MACPARNPEDIEAQVQRMLAMGREIRAHIKGDITSSTDCLYDEDGLPLRGGNFALTDIESALKD